MDFMELELLQGVQYIKLTFDFGIIEIIVSDYQLFK